MNGEKEDYFDKADFDEGMEMMDEVPLAKPNEEHKQLRDNLILDNNEV